MDHLPIGRLALQLEALTTPAVRMAIVVAATVLLVADLSFPMIGMLPLYVPLVCAAAWRLSESETYVIAIAVALVSLAPIVVEAPVQWTITFSAQAVLRIGCSIFIAAILRSFRRAFDRERFMARRDLMTGAMNKATFERHAEKMIHAAAAVDRPLLLATIDLDDFKAINDKHGHAAGDAVLRAFAASASTVLRRRDSFGRLGGDEFALLASVDSLEDGRNTAHQLHERLNLVLADLPHPVTFSMGALVLFPDAVSRRARLMHETDRLMYRAKLQRKGSLQMEVRGGSSPRSDAAGPRRVGFRPGAELAGGA